MVTGYYIFALNMYRKIYNNPERYHSNDKFVLV